MHIDINILPLVFIESNSLRLNDYTNKVTMRQYNSSEQTCYGIDESGSFIAVPYSDKLKKIVLDPNLYNDINNSQFDDYIGINGIKDCITNGHYVVIISDEKERENEGLTR